MAVSSLNKSFGWARLERVFWGIITASPPSWSSTQGICVMTSHIDEQLEKCKIFITNLFVELAPTLRFLISVLFPVV